METTRERERRRIEKSFQVFELTQEQREEILEALDSPEWDWFEDCDGCTGVSDLHWPTKYFPPCLRHDYDWMRGDGGGRERAVLQAATGVWGSSMAVRAAGWCSYGGVVCYFAVVSVEK